MITTVTNSRTTKLHCNSAVELFDGCGFGDHLDDCMKEGEGEQQLLPDQRLGGAAGLKGAFGHVCVCARNVGFDSLGGLAGQLDTALQD